MFKRLEKYGFITILPFQETYFFPTNLPKKVKLSKEIVDLNYLKYSPFKNPTVLTYSEDTQLLIWFYPHAIEKIIVLPESYLAFRELKKKSEDALYIIKDKIIKVIAIKNNSFVGAFTLDEMDETTIALNMDEYQLSKKVYLSQVEYATLIKNSQKSISYKELYTFTQIELDKKVLLAKFVDKATYPLVALLLFAMLISYIQGKILSANIDQLEQSYKSEKAKNKQIKKAIREHNKEVKKYLKFSQKELAYVGPIILLEAIYRIFPEGDKTYIESITIYGTTMTLQIATNDNPIKYLNRLSDIEYFSQVVIQSSRKPKNGMKIVTYDIQIKMLKDV